MAESFFQLLKRERIGRQIYPTRDLARSDVFHYIEMFYNPRRRHGTAEGLSPVEFERRQSQRLKSVQESWSDSIRIRVLHEPWSPFLYGLEIACFWGFH